MSLSSSSEIVSHLFQNPYPCSKAEFLHLCQSASTDEELTNLEKFIAGLAMENTYLQIWQEHIAVVSALSAFASAGDRVLLLSNFSAQQLEQLKKACDEKLKNIAGAPFTHAQESVCSKLELMVKNTFSPQTATFTYDEFEFIQTLMKAKENEYPSLNLEGEYTRSSASLLAYQNFQNSLDFVLEQAVILFSPIKVAALILPENLENLINHHMKGEKLSLIEHTTKPTNQAAHASDAPSEKNLALNTSSHAKQTALEQKDLAPVSTTKVEGNFSAPTATKEPIASSKNKKTSASDQQDSTVFRHFNNLTKEQKKKVGNDAILESTFFDL